MRKIGDNRTKIAMALIGAWVITTCTLVGLVTWHSAADVPQMATAVLAGTAVTMMALNTLLQTKDAE